MRFWRQDLVDLEDCVGYKEKGFYAALGLFKDFERRVGLGLAMYLGEGMEGWEDWGIWVKVGEGKRWDGGGCSLVIYLLLLFKDCYIVYVEKRYVWKKIIRWYRE